MSSITGQVLQVYNAIWTALEANADWSALVKPGCRIKYVTDPTNGYSLRKPTKSPSDVPEAMLQVTGPLKDTLYTVGETFNTMKPGFAPRAETWIEYITVNYLLTLTTRGFVVDELDPLVLLTFDAIRDAGPKLGVSFVRRVGDVGRGISGDVRSTSSGDAGGMFRIVTKIPIPVFMQFEGRNLITPP